LEKAFPFPAWEKLDEVANLQNLGLEIRKEQVPSTSAFPSLPTSPDSKSSKRVLLYRDTNGWCPFCERVICALVEKNIEFDCVYIDLRNKPAWYLDIVETGLVPAAEIDGRLVWESKDILDALEETFPEPSLLPTEFSEDANAASALADTLSRAGFSFLRGREYGSDGPGDPTELLESFRSRLQEMEDALARHPGPFFLPQFSLADVVHIPHMQRFAAYLPNIRDEVVLHGPGAQYPRIAAWLDALEERPGFRAVKSDPETHVQVVRRLFGVQPSVEAERPRGASAAGARLVTNREAVVKDVLANAGLDSGDSFVRQAVELTVGMLAAELLGEAPAKPDLADDPPSKARFCAVAAAVLAFLRSRVSSPRDMPADAASSFRAAIDKMLREVYW